VCGGMREMTKRDIEFCDVMKVHRLSVCARDARPSVIAGMKKSIPNVFNGLRWELYVRFNMIRREQKQEMARAKNTTNHLPNPIGY
jgi:hypothetical protein